MTSSECDRFMGKHSAMAVRVGADGIWIAWDLFISKYPFDTDLVYGLTREEAVSKYKSLYHPEKPHSAYNDHIAQQAKVFADSAKYHRIVEEYEGYERRTVIDQNTSPANSIFAYGIFNIIKDDLKLTHCDKCGQELP